MELADTARAGATFEEHRGRLWGVAYRMLGSRADADDVVQEAYLRWHGAERAGVRAPRAWLVTTTTRLCIDRLRQLRAERETYTGPWLPEPLVDSAPPADATTELASDLSMAFLSLLERLAPDERAAFLLHDVFEADYAEIAPALGKSEAACRQIVSRARRRVREQRPRVREVSAAARERLVEAFARAVRLRDRDALLAVFTQDATWTSDGGGKAKAARKVVRGGASVARFVLGVLRPVRSELELRKIRVNSETGLAMIARGRLVAVVSFSIAGGKIDGVFSVLNPDKLRGVSLAEAREPRAVTAVPYRSS